jgi:hypothetical protein
MNIDRITASRQGHMFRFIDGPVAELVFLDDDDEPERRRVPRPTNDTTPTPKVSERGNEAAICPPMSARSHGS